MPAFISAKPPEAAGGVPGIGHPLEMIAAGALDAAFCAGLFTRQRVLAAMA